MSNARQEGFTLIEVTLAIVIGVTVVAGGILLYQQAMIAAGNSRMQEKLMSVAGRVETYAAQNYGQYPVAQKMRYLYQRMRPDDHLTSPWGGVVGEDLRSDPYMLGLDVATWAAADAVFNTANYKANYDFSGGIGYYPLAAGVATASRFDNSRGQVVVTRGYMVMGFNQDNLMGWGVFGPKP